MKSKKDSNRRRRFLKSPNFFYEKYKVNIEENKKPYLNFFNAFLKEQRVRTRIKHINDQFNKDSAIASREIYTRGIFL